MNKRLVNLPWKNIGKYTVGTVTIALTGGLWEAFKTPPAPSKPYKTEAELEEERDRRLAVMIAEEIDKRKKTE